MQGTPAHAQVTSKVGNCFWLQAPARVSLDVEVGHIKQRHGSSPRPRLCGLGIAAEMRFREDLLCSPPCVVRIDCPERTYGDAPLLRPGPILRDPNLLSTGSD